MCVYIYIYIFIYLCMFDVATNSLITSRVVRRSVILNSPEAKLPADTLLSPPLGRNMSFRRNLCFTKEAFFLTKPLF